MNFCKLKKNLSKVTKIVTKLTGFLLKQTIKMMLRVFNKHWISVNFCQLKNRSEVIKLEPKLVGFC